MSRALVTELLHLGHDTVHCRDLGNGKHPDYLQLVHAYRDHRILVTKDQTHFGELHGVLVSWANDWDLASTHSGIVTIPDKLPNDQIATAIHELVTERSASIAGKLFNLTPQGNWEEMLVGNRDQC
jgi:hypothetical protein